MSDGTIGLDVVVNNNNAQREMDKLNKSVANITKTVEQTTSGFATLAKSVTAAFATFSIGNSIINLANDAQQLENKLKLVTKSTTDLIQVQGDLLKISQKSYGTVSQATNIYSLYAKSVDKSKASQEDLLQVTLNTQRAMALSGGSVQSANDALIQLGQGIASGTLRGEELNSVLEQTPRIAQAIADGMGVTLGSLRQIAAEGKLTSDNVFKALLSQTESLNQEFGKMTISSSQGFGILTGSLRTVAGSALLSTGVFSAMGNVFADLGTKVLTYKNALDATAAIAGLNLFRVVDNVRVVWEGVLQVMSAVGTRITTMIPGISFFQKNLASLTAANLVSGLDQADKSINNFYLAVRKAVPFLRELSDYARQGLFDTNSLAFAIADVFRSKSILEYRKNIENLINVFNNPINRDWYTFVRDVFYPKPVADFVMQTKNLLSVFGLLDAPLVRLSNIRLDMLREGFTDIYIAARELVHLDIVLPIRQMWLRVVSIMYSAALNIIQYGRQLGNPLGDFLVGMGRGITQLLGISTKLETSLNFTFGVIKAVILNELTGIAFKIAPAVFSAVTESLSAVARFLTNNRVTTAFVNLGRDVGLSIFEGISNLDVSTIASAFVRVSKSLGKSGFTLGKSLVNNVVAGLTGFASVSKTIGKELAPKVLFKELFELNISDIFSYKIIGPLVQSIQRLSRIKDMIDKMTPGSSIIGVLFGASAISVDISNLADKITSLFKKESLGSKIADIFKSFSSTNYLDLMFDKVMSVTKLDVVYKYVHDFCNKVGQAFFDVYDAVVGHSYWPDLIEGVTSWSRKLGSESMPIINSFVNAVGSAFLNVYNYVASAMGNLSSSVNPLASSLLGTEKQISDSINKFATQFTSLFRKKNLSEKISDGLKITFTKDNAVKFLHETVDKITTIKPKDLLIKLTPQFILDGITSLPVDKIASFARIAATAALIGISSAIFPVVGTAVLAYFSGQAVSIFLRSMESASISFFGGSALKQIGIGIGDIIGTAISRAVHALPEIIDGVISLMAGFGEGLLSQLGAVGKAISVVLGLFSGGNSGLLTSLIFGAGVGYLEFGKQINGILKTLKEIKGVAGNAIGGVIPDVLKASGTGLINKIFGKLDTGFLLAGVSVLLLGISEEVTFWQAVLGATPLLFTAIVGKDVAAKLVIDIAKNIFAKIIAMTILASRSIAASNLFNSFVGDGVSGKFQATFDKIINIAKAGGARVAAVMSKGNKDAFLNSGASIGDFFKGTADKTGPNKQSSPIKEAIDAAMKTPVSGASFGGLKDKIAKSLSEAAAIAKTKVSDIKAAVEGSSVSFGSMVAAIRATMLGSVVAVQEGAAVMASTVAGAAASAQAKAASGQGIFGSALFGKALKWSGIAALLALFASGANAAVSDTTSNAESSSKSVTGNILSSIGTMISAATSGLGTLGNAALEVVAPLLTIASIVTALGGGGIVAAIGSFLLTVGSAILAFFVSLPGLILAAVTGVGLLALYIFGDGNSFSEKLENAKNDLLNFFGFWDSKMSSRQRKLTEMIAPNKDTADGMALNTKLSSVNYQTISSKDYGALEKLTAKTNEIMTRNNEILEAGEQLTAENIKELTKAMGAVDKVVATNVNKSASTSFDSFGKGLEQQGRISEWFSNLFRSKATQAEKDAPIPLPQKNVFEQLTDNISKRMDGLNEAMSTFAYQVGVVTKELLRDKRVDPYKNVKDKVADAGTKFQDIKGDLTVGEVTAMDKALNELGNAYANLTNAKNNAWFSDNSIEIKKASVAAEVAELKFDSLNKMLQENAAKAKGAREASKAYKDLATDLETIGVKSDIADFGFGPDALQSINILVDDVKAKMKEISDSPIEARASLMIDKAETVRQLGEVIDNAKRDVAPRRFVFEDLINKTGVSLKMDDLFKMDTSNLDKAKSLLEGSNRAAQALTDAFNKGNVPLSEMVGLIQQVQNNTRELAKQQEDNPANTTAQRLAMKGNRLGVNLDPSIISRVSGGTADKLASKTDKLDNLDATAKDITLGLKERKVAEKSAAVLRAQMDYELGKISDGLKIKDFFEALSDKFSKSGLTLSAEQLLGLPSNFIGKAQSIVAKATGLRNEILKQNTSTEGITKAAALFKKLQDQELEIQRVLANTPSYIGDALQSLFTNVGNNFDMSRFLSLDDNSRKELADINAALKDIELRKKQIKSVNGELTADQVKQLKQLESEENAKKNRQKQIGGSTFNIFDQLDQFAQATGVTLSKLDFSRMSENLQQKVKAAFTEGAKGSTDFNNGQPKTQAEDQKNQERLFALQEKIGMLTKGEIPYLSEKLGIQIDMNALLYQDVDAYDNLLKSLKAVNAEEYARLKTKLAQGDANDQDLLNLKEMERARKRITDQQALNQEAIKSTTMGEFVEKLSKLNITVDPAILTKLGTSVIGDVEDMMKRLNQAKFDYANATPGSKESIDAANRVSSETKGLNRIGEQSAEYTQLKSTFSTAGADFVKGVLTNTGGAWTNLLTTVTGAISDRLFTKIGDSLFGGLTDWLAKTVIGDVGPGGTMANPWYVRLMDAVNGTATIPANTDANTPKSDTQPVDAQAPVANMVDQFTSGLSSILGGLSKGFGGLLQSIFSMLGGGGGGSSFGALLSIGTSLMSIFGGGGAAASASSSNYSLGSGTSSLEGLKFKAKGGKITGPGTGTSDSILAGLSNGEFVVKATSVQKYGSMLDAINNGTYPKFATGGLVGASFSPMDAISKSSSVKSTNNGSVQQTIQLNITGDISRQTKSEIYKMLPSIAEGVNSHNKEKGYKQ